MGLRRRFTLQVVIAVAAGGLVVLTLFSRDWIETVFHTDPDSGSGTFEWLIVVALVVIAVGMSAWARRTWLHIVELSAKQSAAAPASD